ncbi:hydroxylamine reductase [Cetobacterium sp. 8H]|uniref:hydroxylamine reductase n=1 Tax=Cetobacterium sp. 8H TaxID=2759681 RepID=UPI00163C8D5D|nr:hydroxylamine reductase [Cetobacterium sp. 8H]MBC2851873.1 hydroxylamine reductase [Cetobacterium sp. 8H]
MSMFCYQCQETAMNKGCTIRGVCGKTPETAKLQDLLIHTAKTVSAYINLLNGNALLDNEIHRWVVNSLFITITNANFDDAAIIDEIEAGEMYREALEMKISELSINIPEKYSKFVDCSAEIKTEESLLEYAEKVGVLRTTNEDIRSLKETILYGLKGMSAYVEHAKNLGKESFEIYRFMETTLADIDDESLTLDDLVKMVLDVGKFGVMAMELLDNANTSAYGNPEITKVNLGVRTNPGILISGHDLRDLEMLLEQTKDTGVDVYTHSEMLPGNSYPFFKKYNNLVGNYGGSWWHQTKEFISFNGPILFTSNCLVPPRGTIAEYLNRVYTTNSAGMPECKHISENEDGVKDFSEIIEQAKTCDPPLEIEKGEIYGGFAHNQVLNLSDKVIEAVKSGAIKKFYVMAGCDARMQDRKYYTDFALALPKDTVILTAGCAKYRYNKLDLGDIGGIPRVLDAGQCNDSYSLAVIALKLKDAFGLKDVNDLPIVFNIAWYEQKAVLVLLSLLYLGFKKVHIGPTLPAFLTPNVLKVLVDNFELGTISTVENDIKNF